MINNNKEYIASAAIWYNDGLTYEFQGVYGVRSGFVLGGFRHPLVSVIVPSEFAIPNQPNELLQVNKSSKYTIVEGFITSYGRFVDRIDARKIAIECGQCSEDSLGKLLYSEDIFRYQLNNGYDEEM